MKIIVKNLQKKIPVNPKGIKKIALKALALEGIKKSGQITVCFVNDRKIKELNLKFLEKNYATDVLSFNESINKKEILADIAISTDRAIYNAKLFKTSILYEVCLYVVHGVLHLLGYDDETKKQRKLIDEKSNSILKTLHITH